MENHKETVVQYKYFSEPLHYIGKKQYICHMAKTKEKKPRTILMVEMAPEFHTHLKETAVKKKATLSRYVRAALQKVSGYKEKELV